MAGLTIEAFISMKKPGNAIPSPSGSRFAMSVSQYDIEKQRTQESVIVGDIGSSLSKTDTVLDGLKLSGLVWASDDVLLYLRPGGAKADEVDCPIDKSDKEASKLLEARAESSGVELWSVHVKDGTKQRVGQFPKGVEPANMSFNPARELLSFSAEVYASDPALEAVAKIDKQREDTARGSDAKVYDDLYVRHWNAWSDGKVNKVFICKIASDQAGTLQLDLKAGFMSPIAHSKVNSPSIGGGAQDFQLSSDGTSLICMAKTPELPVAWHTRTDVYAVPVYARNKDEKKPLPLTTGEHGATSSPVFAPSATQTSGKAAWLQMDKDGYEADYRRIIIIDLETREKKILAMSEWDRSPHALKWSNDGKGLYLLVEDYGRTKIFYLALDSANEHPVPLTSEATVESFEVLPGKDHRLLLTISSLNAPNEAYLLEASSMAAKPTLTRLTQLNDLSKLGLEPAEDFEFKGGNDKTIHGFIVRPPGVKSKSADKKYPLCVWVHGGPQGAWSDSFHFRWNAAVSASRGYITLLMNITGSTGYGQELTDAIGNNWGGTPYKDTIAGVEHCLDAYPEIDRERIGAAGASYGAYFMNWLEGHPTSSFTFKTLVNHCCLFNIVNSIASDEQFFPEREFDGTIWSARENYERWSPHNFIDQWSTPMLVIHGAKDYRLPIAEGLSTFNTLQRLGIPSRFIYYPTEGHFVEQPANSLHWHNEVYKWLDEWLL
ncbi:uncharacterized protein L969DRAFT_85801 [Mixia osmundae IAM 14324]|nr:uncharacterized protein L969DRAFT_85801 [Mixia osmundae IAM 14324]KEI40593.1 hypothetical protein L969DRAFT_85801 [Mixia osmundae IAM 14324]